MAPKRAADAQDGTVVRKVWLRSLTCGVFGLMY